jgi:membrane fusion protein, multidrug efflux system
MACQSRTSWRAGVAGQRSCDGARAKSRRRKRVPRCYLVTLPLMLLVVAGCDEPQKQAETPRPVRIVAVMPHELDETLSQVGEIQARTEIDVSFRIGGKIVRRAVDVGSEVTKGSLLALLDDQPERNRLRSAEAAVTAAEAENTRTEAEVKRQSLLLSSGYATKQHYETAVRDFQTAQAQLDSARVQVNLAKENLAYTELRADMDGVITGVYADAGQVAATGEKIVRIADPQQREAVFSIPAASFGLLSPDQPVEIALTGDKRISAHGKVRYISPQADPMTRTYQVRVSLVNPPPEMRLGATITGTTTLSGQLVIELPSVAFFEKDGKPAVWLLDPATGTVDLKPVSVRDYTANTVLVSAGLKQGDLVVTAGVHVLRPGQKVRMLAKGGS